MWKFHCKIEWNGDRNWRHGDNNWWTDPIPFEDTKEDCRTLWNWTDHLENKVRVRNIWCEG